MESSEMEAAFTSFLGARGLTIEGLDGPAAVDAVLEFYAAQRFDDVDLDADGDMLLFQWGTYDWDGPPTFQFDLTRQTISGDGEDDEIWQLHLVLHFDPTDETAALGSGDRWCESPDEVASFREFIGFHPSTRFAESHTPARVELLHEEAG